MGSGSRRRKRARLIAAAAVTAAVLAGAGTFIAVKASETSAAVAANQTEAAAYTPTPAVTPSAPAPPKLNGVSAALKNIAEPFVIGVIGDSTGNGPDEWVSKMSEGIAVEAKRTVEFRNYNYVTKQYVTNQVYGPKTSPVRVYNVGVPGATTDELTPFLKGLYPVAPSLIIVSVGHNQQPSTVTQALGKFIPAIKAEWPKAQILLVGQNPSQDRFERQKQTVNSVMTWADYLGYPSVSVFNAFANTPNFGALYADNVHVNAEGSKLWAGVVQRYLLDNA